MVTSFDALKSSVITFASSCVNKLRGQHSFAKAVTVFVTTNRFRLDLPQHSDSYTQLLPVPTSDTLEIVNAAVTALQQIYKEGFHYKKSGVILSEISQTEHVQQFLFDNIPNRPDRRGLMKAIDAINQNYGANKIYIGASGGSASTWQNKSENRSSNYLTDLNDILTVKI